MFYDLLIINEVIPVGRGSRTILFIESCDKTVKVKLLNDFGLKLGRVAGIITLNVKN